MSGTTNASTVYVNDRSATVGAGTFSNTGIPLALGVNTITAAAKGGTENWSIDQITITRSNGNQPPNLDITISDRGGLVHNTGCIMSTEIPALAPVFCAPQIRTIRNVLVPGPGGP